MSAVLEWLKTFLMLYFFLSVSQAQVPEPPKVRGSKDYSDSP